ncbi:UbiA prenyltransferase family [Bombardia bombarda]|uniref:Diterpenoid pyrone biosynthesis cluster protein C n=1 Tax=Bombardia bombarda TaxID=252184 RepID=A0AA40CGE5_9PEZI|nr:UbiA prenyltransferase family [Bombardia bombarda]
MAVRKPSSPKAALRPKPAPPSSSLLSLYAELGRYGNPFPVSMIYFPHLIGTIFAACTLTPQTSNSIRSLLLPNLLLIPASSLLHGLGCTWNDLVDAPLDKLVERTRTRPVPRGAISRLHAGLFAVAQVLLWLGTLSLISRQVVLWALPLIPMVAFYPYAKRLVPIPSVVLGVILAYGVLIGFAAINPTVPLDSRLLLLGAEDEGGEERRTVLRALLCIVAAYTVFVTSIDMIYAHQDLKDDLQANIKSMAVTFQRFPKPVLTVLAVMQLAFLIAVGRLMEFGALYHTIAGVGGLMVNLVMIWRVDLKSSKDCFWWFQAGTFMMGSILSAGFASELLASGQIPGHL